MFVCVWGGGGNYLMAIHVFVAEWVNFSNVSKCLFFVGDVLDNIFLN